ncbi:MAG: ubiquinol-cytochrome c reductase iron-sulfur subunit [Synechococcales cyanobacterium T60_A2020_003]|nr:ubiquinol-cytochrome c reductase iron-sulfur subunit [Synechococcales cyanobacterium T60_A2020_003]
MDRREFLTWIGVGSLATSLPIAIAACAPESTSSDTSASPSADGEVVGTVSELSRDRPILREDTALGAVMVIQDANNTAIAVNPTCPHAGCMVDWKAAQNLFVCPCHNSQFGPDGSLVQGPSTKPLASYAVSVEGDNIVVR